MTNKISISTLPFEFENLSQKFAMFQKLGIDYVHCDIMDGIFVPNMTYSPQMLSEKADSIVLPLDVHLMVAKPLDCINVLSKCATYITLHCECFKNIEELKKAIYQVRQFGVKVGVAVDINTDATSIDAVLNIIDIVLVMSVKAGAGGQKFNSNALAKIKYFVEKRMQHNFRYQIEVDGGINGENVVACVHCGADIIVSGSYIAKAKDMQAAVNSLRVN